MQKKPNENNSKIDPRPNPRPCDPKKIEQQRAVEQFKRRYFEYYDDIKISVKEDW